MTESDEEELHRLAAMLERLDGTLDPDSPLREGLKKAGFALCIGFLNGSRPEIERQYEQVGRPLSETERAHLRSMGIDPERLP